MIGSEKNNKLPTEEMILKMELISLWEGYHLMQLIQCMNVIFKAGLLETSVEDLVSYLEEQNSSYGQEPNFMIKFSLNMDGNIITMPYKVNFKLVRKMVMLTMVLILTKSEHPESLMK